MIGRDFKELLVVIPHSGIIVPHEISLDSVTDDFTGLMRNVDWYTNWLYDFRDILGNSQIVFPYNNLVLEGNRHPDNITDSVPLKDALGELVYKNGFTPDEKQRGALSQKYLKPFHRSIEQSIKQGVSFMLDAHSTLSAKGMTDNQIELMSYQVDSKDGKVTYFCPDIVVETYADALIKLLPGIEITVNQSRYDKVYGHVCGAHTVNSIRRIGSRVPGILQETNQKLYMTTNQTPDFKALETLRRAFAEALYKMKLKVLKPH